MIDMKDDNQTPQNQQHDAKLPVIWRFSGVRTMDGKTVYGEYPFTYQEGRECYNMAAFWRHVQNGWIDPKTVKENAI